MKSESKDSIGIFEEKLYIDDILKDIKIRKKRNQKKINQFNINYIFLNN